MLTIALTATLLMSADEPAPLDDLYEPPLLETGVSMSCKSDGECRVFTDYPLCHPELFECVECFDDIHCDEGWTCSMPGRCEDACSTDGDCEGIGGRSTCDPEVGWCVGCLDASDCPDTEYCMEQTCLPDHCIPGEQFCFESTLMLCLEDGGSTMAVEDCPLGCEDTEGGAQCVQPGGDESAGTGSATGGPATSATAGEVTGPDGGTTNPEDEAPIRDGCACGATPARGTAGAWLLLLGTGFVRRRRWR